MAEASFTSAYVMKDSKAREEAVRLNNQHQFIHQFTGFYLHPSIPIAGAIRIADVATGTGIWMQDVETELASKNDSGARIVTRQLDGFDMTLRLTPEDHPTNFRFIEHNMCEPFPNEYHGLYDVVHARLLIAALRKSQIPEAVANLLQLIKPGGYLQWDDWVLPFDHTPKSDLYETFNKDLDVAGRTIGFDRYFTKTVRELCEQAGMAVTAFEYNSLEDKNMVNKTKELAQLWQMDTLPVLLPLALKFARKATDGEEIDTMTRDMLAKFQEEHERGVVPGAKMVSVVAQKKSN